MLTSTSIDVLVLGAGPGALAIAAALAEESLRVQVLSANDRNTPWPYTYGIWGDEIDELGLQHLLEYRWKNTVSYFGEGSSSVSNNENSATKHLTDYGLFDKSKLQKYWLNKCEEGGVKFSEGIAKEMEVDKEKSKVITIEGEELVSRLLIDATGYDPVFLKSRRNNPIAVQTCYGIVAHFNKDPIEKDQFVLMDYRCNHLTEEERSEPPSFLYAMDLGGNTFFLEETLLVRASKGMSTFLETQGIEELVLNLFQYHLIQKPPR